MEGINLDQLLPGLPPAVVLLLYFILRNWNDIKTAIQRLYSDRYADTVDKREANQDIQASRLDFEFQSKATEASRQWAGQEIAFALMREMLQWAKKDFTEMDNKIGSLNQNIGLLNQDQIKLEKRVEALGTIQLQILGLLSEALRKRGDD